MRYDFDLTRIPDDLLWSGVTVRGRSDAGSAIYCYHCEGRRGFGLNADEAKENWRPKNQQDRQNIWRGQLATNILHALGSGETPLTAP